MTNQEIIEKLINIENEIKNMKQEHIEFEKCKLINIQKLQNKIDQLENQIKNLNSKIQQMNDERRYNKNNL
jgi:hypothetical protein